MQFPKLTPLQSRFLACLGTSILLVIIYYSLSPTHFAYAAEIEATLNQDHNHHRIYNDLIDWEDEEHFDIEVAGYQSDFGPGVDRSLIGRAASGIFALANNVPTTSTIAAGEMQYFVFDNASLWTPLSPIENGLPANLSSFSGNVSRAQFHIPLDDPDDTDDGTEDLAARKFKLKRQNNDDGSRKVTITVNTVVQPLANASFAGPMPQCTLYVSLSPPPAGQPGPGPGNNDQEVPLVEGYAIANVNASNGVYVSVSAPPPSALNGLSGSWRYAVVASIDGSFYGFSSAGSGIFPIDTDSTTGLIATFNLTDDNSEDNATATLREQFLAAAPPFDLFVFNATDPRINGVQNSYAALANINTNVSVNASMTNRGMGANVKEQFYIQGLQAGTTYTAILAYNSENFSQVWKPVNFTTKRDGNCKLLFGLDFCSDVAYAVPFNGTTDFETLATLYDNSTYQNYLYFSYSLQQIACNTTSSAQYSLVRNCSDCDNDYRNWLCAVSIPRCHDFSAPSTGDYSFLTPRDVASNFTNGTAPDLNQPGLNSSMANVFRFNSSRNPFIDQTIVAQPYKEVLPCEELCYELVKSCPAALQFACPKPIWMLRRSYGEVKTTALAEGMLTCNWPNMDWPVLSSAPDMRGRARFAFWVAGAVMVLLCAW